MSWDATGCFISRPSLRVCLWPSSLSRSPPPSSSFSQNTWGGKKVKSCLQEEEEGGGKRRLRCRSTVQPSVCVSVTKVRGALLKKRSISEKSSLIFKVGSCCNLVSKTLDKCGKACFHPPPLFFHLSGSDCTVLHCTVQCRYVRVLGCAK